MKLFGLQNEKPALITASLYLVDNSDIIINKLTIVGDFFRPYS